MAVRLFRRNVTGTTICHDMLKLRPRSLCWAQARIVFVDKVRSSFINTRSQPWRDAPATYPQQLALIDPPREKNVHLIEPRLLHRSHF